MAITYEQARRDLLNGIEHLAVGGWLVLHDMFPREWREAHGSQISEFWTGEVWKLAFDLVQSHDVDSRLIKIDHGVGVMRKIRDNSRIPDNRSALRTQHFQFFYDNIDMLPVIDYESAKAWIERAPGISELPYSHEASNTLSAPDVDPSPNETLQ
jgi:hypothetical protein